MKEITQLLKITVVAVILLFVAISALGADAITLPKTQMPKQSFTVQPQIKEFQPAHMPPTDLAKMTQSLDRAKAIKTEALVMLNKIKILASETTAIIDSYQTPNIGDIYVPVGSYLVNSTHESPDMVGSSGSCDKYLSNVTTAEGNCGRHLDNMTKNKEVADEVKKDATFRCSSKQGIAPDDKQYLKSTLNEIKTVSAGNVAGIDTLIVRIDTLIAQYEECLKSKK